MNDYAADYFGSFDMIDQNELDRLCQEYQQASEYRKSLEPKYEEPVTVQPFAERALHDCESDMDSWGMNLMRESAWLKNSATENLDGFGKTIADVAIDVGQGVALSPLLLAGSGAYTAGVAANAAAEDMYAQTAAGKAPHEALLSGALTAGVEVAGAKISDINNKAWQDATEKIATGAKWIIKEKRPLTEMAEIIKNNPTLKKNLEVGIRHEAEREAALYLIDYLADELWREPENELNLGDAAQSAAENISSRFLEKREDKIAKEIKRLWNTLG